MARGDGYSIIKRIRNGKELANLEVRIQVPVAWQSKLGRKERLVSLKTGDRRQANIIAPEVVANQIAEWRHLVNQGKQSLGNAVDPASLAVRVAYDGMLAAMEDRRKAWPADDAEYAARLAERAGDLRRLTRRLQDGELDQWKSMADRMIAEHGLAFQKGTEAYDGFVRDLAAISIDATSVFIRNAGGELDAGPRTRIVKETKARAAATADRGETLLDLFERWADEMLAKGAKRQDTVNQDRKVIERFSAFVGLEKAIDAVTPQDVCDYRDTMRMLPPKWMSKRELRNLDMRAAAAKARELHMPQTEFTNVNKHLSTISPLYKWLGARPKWAGLRNPCDGLFYTDVKGRNRRPSFSTASLNEILASPLFTGFKADGEEHLKGNIVTNDWRRWIPLVAMFTGARIGEVAQLRVGDIRQERGVWFLHIRHDREQGLTTKSGKSRPAAVHTMLARLGFLSFHAGQLERAAGDMSASLFPELVPNARGQISGRPSRWWRDYLEAIGVKSGGDGFGVHSFRHTLADRLRSEAELMDNQIAVCLGHSNESTTSGYGELSQGTVNMLKGWMDALRFDGVEFSRLFAAAEAEIGNRDNGLANNDTLN